MGDKSSIHSYDPETKQQSSAGTKSRRPAVQQRAGSLLLQHEGSVRPEFVPPGTMVNSSLWISEMPKRKLVMKMTGTLAKPQPAPSS
jgi:hypothetical protein